MPTTIPFTPIEEMTHHMDQKFTPWNMQGELRSSGTVDIERLEAATTEAMAVHPMGGARRRPASAGDRRYSWELRDDHEPAPVVEVDSSEADLQEVRNRLYARRFDLTEEAPFRIVIYRGGGIDGGDRILQSTSHVAADGVGTLRFSQAVWTAYKGGTPLSDSVTLAESRSFLQDIEPSTIADRVAAVESLTRRVRGAVSSPTDIATEGGSDRDGWGYTGYRLSRELTDRLVADRPDGVSVNDVLLSALHLAVAAWNDDHGKTNGKLSVMMPVNLRPKDWFYQVMAMYSMFESVRTGRGHRRDPADTIERVSHQTTRIKERHRAAALFKALSLLPDELPVALERQLPELLRGPGARLTDTVLLTNLGNIPAYPSVGPDTEEEPVFTPPTWDSVPFGFGVASLDGRINLFGRHLLSHFDEDAGERLTETYGDHIEALIEELPSLEVD